MDPRKAIGGLDDTLPILLLPVRVETRFGTAPDTGARQLWVRVFPDECSIDTFEAELSDDEVAAVRRYWAATWAAGGIEAQERTAWRGLVAGCGSGRARYVLGRLAPADTAARPHKALPEDIVLVLLLDAPLPAAERAAIEEFWIATWRAGTDPTALAAARAALAGAVGDDRAAEVEAQLAPANLGDAPAPGTTRADADVQVAELVLGAVAAVRTASWTRAPTAELLPDCFAVLGYPDAGPPVVAVGNPIASPLVAGPDPADPPHQDDDGELVVPDALHWTVDFDRAVQDGMGLRVDLAGAATGGFRRLLVVGLRASADPATAQAALETLLRHHAQSRGGLALLGQGTPTNNTEEASSGLLRGDDADASFGATALFTDTADPLDRRDGQWLAELLGLDADVLRDVPGAGGSDQADARAMNAALWPATLGTWMDTLMAPVFGDAAVAQTRSFLTRFVSGRGAVPPVRIGRQPYGILPATAFSRISWLDARVVAGVPGAYLRGLYALLGGVAADWEVMAARVPSVAEPGDDPHATLLDILGLHPGSVEYAQRWTERFAHVRRRLALEGLDRAAEALDPARIAATTRGLLSRLGWDGDAPELAELLFFERHNRLTGPVVDPAPLSETAGLSPATQDGRTYLDWLVEAASTSLDALYRQEGFAGGQPPNALLYLLARHALQLGYHATGARLHAAAGKQVVRGDAPFLHLTAGSPSASRYAPLLARDADITGSDALDVGGFIGQAVGTLPQADGLRDQLRALEHLAGASTARLERAFAEHVDLCSYRLDAWMQGLVAVQLSAMRGIDAGRDGAPRRGLHLGAYAWLEDLRPDAGTPEEVALDGDLAAVFAGDTPLVRDPASEGHVLAPSLNHAVTAAVLRSAHGAHDGQALGVNLTSARVRDALDLLEGVRQGQGLGALLGYKLERGLHDAHALAEVDRFILDLRRAFPLAGDRLASTSTAAAGDPAPIEAVEARNVVDGLALVEQVAASGERAYPFGRDRPARCVAGRARRDRRRGRRAARSPRGDRRPGARRGRPPGGARQLRPRRRHLRRLREGRVPARAAGREHAGRRHRPHASRRPASRRGRDRAPVGDAARPLRARAGRLAGRRAPDLGDVACAVAFTDAAGTPAEEEITLADLGLRPLDLLTVLRDDADQGTGELDDRVLLAVDAAHAPRPSDPVRIRYMDAGSHPISVFELLPLVRSLRALLAAARPLRPTDLRPGGAASAAQDGTLAADRAGVAAVRADLETLRDDLDALRAELEAAQAVAPAALTRGMDAAVAEVCDVLARTAVFGVPQAGWTFAHDARHAAFTALQRVCAEVDARWTPRALAAQALVDGEAAGGMPDEERADMLLRAEAIVSTRPIAPRPALGVLRTHVAGAVAAFTARRDAFAAIADTPHTAVGELLDDVQALLPVAAFDTQEPELDHGIALALRAGRRARRRDAAGRGGRTPGDVAGAARRARRDRRAAPPASSRSPARHGRCSARTPSCSVASRCPPTTPPSWPTPPRPAATGRSWATSWPPASTSPSTRGCTAWRASASRCAPGSRRSSWPARSAVPSPS